MLGTPGVSATFMVGVAHVEHPECLAQELAALRQHIVTDPYLKSIPSVTAAERKTCLAFHAKDDCPEVRMLVFNLLAKLQIKVFVGIRRKSVLASLACDAHAKGVRLRIEGVYDDLIKTTFKNLLHKADVNYVCFARRGKSTRQVALQRAITRAQANFSRDTGIKAHKRTEVVTAVPSDEAGLQAIDYFLWALQRLYERGEDRYFCYLAGHYKLIMDFDDGNTATSYGTWYSDRNPLTKEKMLPITD